MADNDKDQAAIDEIFRNNNINDVIKKCEEDVMNELDAQPENYDKYECIGGICGINDTNSKIEKCTNSQNISGYNKIGGICGVNSNCSSIIECNNLANIVTKDKPNINTIKY